jgi:hypothetical protein
MHAQTRSLIISLDRGIFSSPNYRTFPSRVSAAINFISRNRDRINASHDLNHFDSILAQVEDTDFLFSFLDPATSAG